MKLFTKSTIHQTPKTRKAEWLIVDATDIPAGRLATKVATVLMGKHKPTYSAHQLSGDYVIVINAKDIKFTGNKLANKLYHTHSGHASGLHTKTLGDKMAVSPAKTFKDVVNKMLPKNALRSGMLARLFVYNDAEHKQIAQQPTPLNLDK